MRHHFSIAVFFYTLFFSLIAYPATQTPALTESQNIQKAKELFSATGFDISGPMLSCDIGGIVIQGADRQNRLKIEDYDLYHSDTGARLIPLFRTLTLLKAKGSIEGHKIHYSLATGDKATVDIDNKKLHVGEQEFALEIVPGVSDVTGQGELFVSEDFLANGISAEYSWDDNEFAYLVEVKHALYLFDEMNDKRKNAFNIAVEELSANLPETEPVHLPADSRRSLTFIDMSLRVDNRYAGENHSGTIRPSITAYGQLFHGNYSLHLTESINYPDKHYPSALLWIDDISWKSRSKTMAVRVGDTAIGLSRLTAQTAGYAGVTVRGLAGAIENEKASERFLKGNHFSFTAERDITGYAPLGSKVELFINNRPLYSTVVEEDEGAPAGSGSYSFTGIGLMNLTVNEIITIITMPDGTVDKHVETVAGSNNLLPAGQLAYSFGAGTKRRELDEKFRTEGLFTGLGLFYGLKENITIGMTAAIQDGFYADPDNGGKRMPKRYYFGQNLNVGITDHLFFAEEMGVNHMQDTGDSSYATDLALKYLRKDYTLASYLFSYDKGFLNGATQLGDREGYGLYAAWDDDSGLTLNTAYAGIKSMDHTRTEEYFALNLARSGLPAGISLGFRYDELHKKNEIEKSARGKLHTLDLSATPLANLKFNAEYAWGTQISSPNPEDPRYGIPVPMIGSSLSYGTRMAASYRLPYNITFGAIYRDPRQSSRSMEYKIDRNISRKHKIDAALMRRKDLDNNSYYSELNLEMPLDSKGKNIIGFRGTYNDVTDTYLTQLYMKLGGLFSWGDKRMHRVKSDETIRPESGGIKGKVYLDANANGHYDIGEQGLGEIDVLLNGRTKVLSGSDGFFYAGRRQNEDEIMVSLNEKELSAIYTPTQGKQRARWDEYIFTEVNLGVSVLGAITGTITVWEGDKFIRAIPGALVLLRKTLTNEIVKRSITDDDGIYYLGEVMPGDYILDFEPTSIPTDYAVIGEPPKVVLRSELEPIVLKDMNIRFEHYK